MLDYYHSNPEKLNGQPKRTIADYVESNGILVPRRFDSLKDALNSGLSIFARSEHTQDYDCVSGLLESRDLHLFSGCPELDSEIELKKKLLTYNALGNPLSRSLFNIRSYCGYLGLDATEFENQISFSYWEKLGGYNRTIVADSAISNRYHITAYGSTAGGKIIDYSIIENARVVLNPVRSRVASSISDFDLVSINLINAYERVRQLDRFDKNNCPIMEFQTLDNKNYFLQYHKGKDFCPSTFILDRPTAGDEIVAKFVHGATPPEGIVSKVGYYYNYYDVNFKSRLPVEETGSFDSHPDFILSELMVRKRDLQLIYSENFSSPENLSYEFVRFVSAHDRKSKLFKPRISVIIDSKFERYEDEYFSYSKEAAKRNEFSTILIQTISDGRAAYLKRLD
jgi:hypothetical protein